MRSGLSYGTTTSTVTASVAKRLTPNLEAEVGSSKSTKAASAAVEAGAEDAPALLRAAVKRIDSAAAKGVIHKNAAARRKSRLMRRAASSD